jgi:hypothetical protein
MIGLTRPATQPVIHDIRLDLQGTLHGKLIDLEGRPVIEETLELIREGQVITRTVSGQDGQFRFAQVVGGRLPDPFGQFDGGLPSVDRRGGSACGQEPTDYFGSPTP